MAEQAYSWKKHWWGMTIGPYRYRVTREMVAFAASKEMLSSSRYSGDSSIAPSALTDNDYSLAFIDPIQSWGTPSTPRPKTITFNPPIIGKELIVTGAISDKFNKRGKDFLVFRNDHLRRGRAGDSQKQEYAALKPMTHAVRADLCVTAEPGPRRPAHSVLSRSLRPRHPPQRIYDRASGMPQHEAD